MTSVADWVNDVRGYLLSGFTETLNVLEEAYTPGDGQLTLRYDLHGIGRNTPLSVDQGCFMVWSTVPTVKTCTVTAEYDGAADVSIPSGTIVYVNPRWFTHRIYNALNQVLVELTSPARGLFGIDSLELDIDPSQSVYDLSGAPDLQDILRVQLVQAETDLTDRRPNADWNDWELRRVDPSAEYPTGMQLRVHDLIDYTNDCTAIITYKKPFTQADSIDTDIALTGVPETMEDIPPLGAAAKLSMTAEMRRVQPNAQGDTRRAEEVPVGASIGASRNLQQMYAMRLNDELARLNALYPPRMRV